MEARIAAVTAALALAVAHAQEVVKKVAQAAAIAVQEPATAVPVAISDGYNSAMPKRRIIFIVTQDCQLRCNYCYLIGKNNVGKMTWETAKEIVDFLMSLPIAKEDPVFEFIGGEPLLEIDLISRISDYLVEKMKEKNHSWLDSYQFRFTTNGLNYSSDKVQRYIKKYRDHIAVQISIDGDKKKHDMNRKFVTGEGSYDKLLPNVNLWVKQFGKEAMSMTVISHGDLPYLSESVIHLITLGIKSIVVSMVVEDVWQEGDDKIFEKELMIIADYIIDHRLWNDVTISSFQQDLGEKEKYEHIQPCGLPAFTFDYKGNIYTCLRFVSYSLRSKSPRIIGNIATGLDYNKLRPLMAFDRESSYPEKCLKCEISSGCRWCPAENYDSSATGTIFNRTTTVCELHKANVRVKNYFWNKI